MLVMFNHSILPFRRTRNDRWAIVCLDCCTTTYDFSMTKGVAIVSQDHRGEVRVFSPMDGLTRQSEVVLG